MKVEPDRLVGQSPAFLNVLDDVSALAAIEKPVLVVGERGTGKELIASRLHYLSPRWESVYLQLNCAAIIDSLLESELFGHEAGSFTGATRRHRGRFERAHTGTLFLDELATTAMRVQEKILRVIEYGQFERVGGDKTLSVDVRLIAATNQDLPSLSAEGKFREDLLDRLAFDVITLPPLRERNEDIMLLAEHFAIQMVNELGRELFEGFSSSAQDKLEEHPWPGNVRELKNVVERAVYHNTNGSPIENIVLDPFDSPYRPLPEKSKLETQDQRWTLPLDLKATVRDAEIQIIKDSLENAQFNQRKAAELLGLTYHQFRNYIRKYGLLDDSASDD